MSECSKLHFSTAAETRGPAPAGGKSLWNWHTFFLTRCLRGTQAAHMLPLGLSKSNFYPRLSSLFSMDNANLNIAVNTSGVNEKTTSVVNSQPSCIWTILEGGQNWLLTGIVTGSHFNKGFLGSNFIGTNLIEYKLEIVILDLFLFY